MKPLSPTRKLCVPRRAPHFSTSLPHLFPSKPLQQPSWPRFFGSRPLWPWQCEGPCSAAQPRYTLILALSPIEFASRPPQPRAATSKRLYRTRAELLASPFTPERERASGKALTFIRTCGASIEPCSCRNTALSRRLNAKPKEVKLYLTKHCRRIHGWQPSMANLGLDSNGCHRRLFWSLVVPRWICRSRLSLDSRICLASAAIRGVVCGSPQVSARCHASLDIAMATPAPIGDMPAWCCGLRSRSLFVAHVARAVASRSCLRPLRLACISSRDD
jgi:hypothetical protein